MTMRDLPPSLISTLPGEYYTDPEVFALEQERVLEAMWFCVTRAAELARPGQFRTVQVGRESVLVTVLFSALVLREAVGRRYLIGLVLLVGGTLAMLIR